jgi:hypothetical protein
VQWLKEKVKAGNKTKTQLEEEVLKQKQYEEDLLMALGRWPSVVRLDDEANHLSRLQSENL